ncbi:MAG: hypothetical protein AAF560_08475 [Acidobacteriota bacterium]
MHPAATIRGVREAARDRARPAALALRCTLFGVALLPFAASLDYGLDTRLFRLLPPVLLGVATVCVGMGLRGRLPRPSPIDAAVLALIVCSALSAAHAVVNLERSALAQTVGFAAVAGHAIFFWLGRQLGELRAILRVFVLAMLVAGLAGLAQRVLLDVGICTATSEIPARLENRCLVGGALTYAPELGRIRLPGTAASPWHWSWLLVAGAACAAALLSDGSLRWRRLGIAALVTLLACSFVSGQRVALVLVPLVAAAASLWALGITSRRLARAGLVALGLALLALMMPAGRAALADLGDRWRAAPPPQFVVEQWRWAVRERPGWLGYGPGSATSAARHFEGIVLIESVPAKRLYEGGWLGAGAWVVVVGALLVSILRRWADLGRAERAVSVYVLLLAVMPWWYPTDTDPGNLLFWLLAGMLQRTPAA